MDGRRRDGSSSSPFRLWMLKFVIRGLINERAPGSANNLNLETRVEYIFFDFISFDSFSPSYYVWTIHQTPSSSWSQIVPSSRHRWFHKSRIKPFTCRPNPKHAQFTTLFITSFRLWCSQNARRSMPEKLVFWFYLAPATHRIDKGFDIFLISAPSTIAAH